MRRSKYHARPVWVDGVRFMSQREAARYLDLKLLSQAGEIDRLVLQPHFDLHAPDISGEPARIGRYVADFEYVIPRTGEVVVEDVKGVRLPMYTWKKRHVEAQYGVSIREV